MPSSRWARTALLTFGLILICRPYSDSGAQERQRDDQSQAIHRPVRDAKGILWVTVVPSGEQATFWMGCAQGDDACAASEKPRHQVTLSSYRMMKTEANLADYRRCVHASACTAPLDHLERSNCNWGEPAHDDHPANCINWKQASQFCTWIGAELPTEAQWEYAARGNESGIFPWGNQPISCGYAVSGVIHAPDTGRHRYQGTTTGCGRNMTWPVCSKPRGNSPFGLCDMTGNVYEWVRDWWDLESYKRGPQVDPVVKSPTGGHFARVLKGGSWIDDEPWMLRASRRSKIIGPSDASPAVGVRCVDSSNEQL